MVDQIKYLIKEELEAANKKFPLFASPHEAYAVLLEEVEEAELNFNMMKHEIIPIWNQVKGNRNPIGSLRELQEEAIKCICELIQVCAMVGKIELSHSKNYPGRTEEFTREQIRNMKTK